MFNKKQNRVGELDVYEDPEGKEEDVKPLEKIAEGVKGLWNKTIFPEKIKNAKEEKALKRKIEHEARLEAIEESKEEIKKQKKQKLVDKASGKNKKDFLGKLAKGFGYEEGKSNNNSDKISKMLGGGSSGANSDKISNMLGRGPSGASNDKISNMLGKGPSKQEREDKIKRMLGR